MWRQVPPRPALDAALAERLGLDASRRILRSTVRLLLGELWPQGLPFDERVLCWRAAEPDADYEDVGAIACASSENPRRMLSTRW